MEIHANCSPVTSQNPAAPSKKQEKAHLIELDTDFVGHDGKAYRDLAVDNTSIYTVTYLRLGLEDKNFYLIVSTIAGHTAKKRLTTDEALYLYWNLPVKRAKFEDAFGEEVGSKIDD